MQNTNSNAGRTGRKPIHLEPVNGAPNGRAAIWLAIRKAPHTFTYKDMPGQVSKSLIRDYFTGLTASGHIQVVRQGGRDDMGHPLSTEYRLINDVGVEPPRITRDGKAVTQGLAQEQMWRTMAAPTSFSPKSLAINASTEAIVVTEAAAKSYIRYLVLAKYLRCTRPSKPGTQARYKLVNRTGPKPPAIQRLKSVYDPNTRQVVWAEGGRDE